MRRNALNPNPQDGAKSDIVQPSPTGQVHLQYEPKKSGLPIYLGSQTYPSLKPASLRFIRPTGESLRHP
jgi:hypothetical protein